MTWADLNKRQQVYLQAVYEVDQATEAAIYGYTHGYLYTFPYAYTHGSSADPTPKCARCAWKSDKSVYCQVWSTQRAEHTRVLYMGCSTGEGEITWLRTPMAFFHLNG